MNQHCDESKNVTKMNSSENDCDNNDDICHAAAKKVKLINNRPCTNSMQSFKLYQDLRCSMQITMKLIYQRYINVKYVGNLVDC